MNIPTEKELMDEILNIKYSFNDYYGIAYLTHSEYNKYTELLSKMRRYGYFDMYEYSKIHKLAKIYHNNLSRIKELDRKQPRVVAQRFIGQKEIRQIIFERDGYVCLKCGNESNLTLDHIKPIYYDGENELHNLQTLCRSCNSSKGTKEIDYRNNGSR